MFQRASLNTPRQHNIAGAASFIQRINQASSSHQPPLVTQEQERISHISCKGTSLKSVPKVGVLVSKIKSLRVKGCYKTINTGVTPQGWRHSVEPRGLTSNVEIPSLGHSLRHPLAVFITGTSRQKKKNLSSQSLFYGLLLELLHIQFFFWFSVQPEGQEVLFPFNQIVKFFWVFPPVSPSRNWIMYLQSELPCARHCLAVMWPVCPTTWPCGFCHPFWTDFWCCLSTLCDQGLLVGKCRITYSRSTNHEWASDHLSEIMFSPSFWAPETEALELDSAEAWTNDRPWLLHSLHQIPLLTHKSLLSPALGFSYFFTLAWATSPRQKCTC